MYFCPLCETEGHSSFDGCDCARIIRPVTLLPCAFCGGPPKPRHQQRRIRPRGWWRRFWRRGEMFTLVDAYVFCHECGAQSATAHGYLEDGESMSELLAVLMPRAVLLWQTRNGRHDGLYEASARDGLNLYPRIVGGELP